VVTTAPQSDLEWCFDAVEGVSRTFALTVEVLEDPMARHVCLGYLLCRVADTVEDANHLPPAEQVRLLETYEAALDPDSDVEMTEFRADVEEWLPPAAERSADWDVVAHAPTIWSTFREEPTAVQRAVLPPVREMVGGMAEFLARHAEAGGLRIADAEELEEYCHYAAGTVGILITNLLTREDGAVEPVAEATEPAADGSAPGADPASVTDERSQELYETAEGFGLLLQLVNVAKDVYADYTEENNVYLPADWLSAEGVDQDEVLEPTNREGAAAVVARTAEHAASYLDDAQAYLEAVPLTHGNTLAAWSVPFLLAVGTLRELRARPADALTAEGVSVTRAEVLAVVHAARRGDRGELASLRATIAELPLHQTID